MITSVRHMHYLRHSITLGLCLVLLTLLVSISARAKGGDKPQCGDDAVPQTNAGTQFLLCFEQNYHGFIDEPTDYLRIYLATLDHPATITITCNRYPALNRVITLPARSSNIYKITEDIIQYSGNLRDTLTDLWITSNEIADQRVVQVTSTDDIVCYGMNSKLYTADAFLALPFSTAGTDYRILSFSNSNFADGFTGSESMPSEFAVAAFVDNTSVTITPSALTASGRPAGAPFSFTLKKGECIQVQTDTSVAGLDLTGSMVTSDKPVAVFGAHARCEIPYAYKRADNGQSRDMLLEQMPPTHVWGRSFVVSSLERDAGNFIAAGDLFRVLALNSNTSVKVNGVPWVTLAANKFADTMFLGNAVIEGSGPLLVGEYFHSSSLIQGVGDPSLAVVPPVDQSYNDFTFFASEDANFTTQKVIIATDVRSQSSILFDNLGALPASSFKALPVPAGGRSFSLAQLSVGPGVHHLWTSNTPDMGFTILSYGLGQVISYGYTAGVLMKPLRSVKIKDPSPLSIAPGKHTNRIDFYNTCSDPAYLDSARFVPDEAEDMLYGIRPVEDVAYSVGRMDIGGEAFLHLTCNVGLGAPISGRLKIFSHTPNFTDLEPSELSLTLYPESNASVSGEPVTHLKVSSYPNPFSLFTNIQFTLPAPGDVTLTLFDEVGRAIRTIATGPFGAGPYSIRLERRNLPNGFYTCELTSAKLNIHERVPIVAGE